MKRTDVLSGLYAGRTNKEIFEFFGGFITKWTIQQTSKRYRGTKEKGNITPKRMPHALRSDTKSTLKFMAMVDTAIKADSSKNIVVLAKEFQVSVGMMWKTVRNYLRYKVYKLKVRQLLTKTVKEKCVVRSKKLLEQLEEGRSGILSLMKRNLLLAIVIKDKMTAALPAILKMSLFLRRPNFQLPL